MRSRRGKHHSIGEAYDQDHGWVHIFHSMYLIQYIIMSVLKSEFIHDVLISFINIYINI